MRRPALRGVALKHQRITTDFHSVTSETLTTTPPLHHRHSLQPSNQLYYIYHRITPLLLDCDLYNCLSRTNHQSTFNMAEQAKYYEMYRNAR
jgi:hypothetical protein